MTDVHQWCKMNFRARRPCFIDHFLFLTFVSCDASVFSSFPILSPLPPLHLDFFDAWGIGMNFWTRLKWCRELSSTSTTQANFALRFPNCGGFLHCSLLVFCKALLLASELPTFCERLSLWASIFHCLARRRILLSTVWHCRVCFIDSPSLLCFALRCIRHMLPQNWPCFCLDERLCVSL